MSLHVSTVELNRAFRRGFTLTFTVDLLTKLLSAVTVVVLIRGLAVSAYAYTTLFLTLAQFAGAAAGGGVRTRYLREEAESLSRGVWRERDGLFVISLLKGALLVLAVGVCVLPIVGPLHLGSKFGADSGLVLYAVAFAIGFGATELAIAHYQARRRFGMAGILALVRAAALLLAAVLISVRVSAIGVKPVRTQRTIICRCAERESIMSTWAVRTRKTAAREGAAARTIARYRSAAPSVATCS